MPHIVKDGKDHNIIITGIIVCPSTYTYYIHIHTYIPGITE